jgi:hypothetical protein
VIGKEASRLAEVATQRLHAKYFAGFVFDGLGCWPTIFATPDDSDDFADAALEVQWMVRVIDQYSVPRNADGIRSGHVLRASGQALGALQLAWRTDRQRRKWVG